MTMLICQLACNGNKCSNSKQVSNNNPLNGPEARKKAVNEGSAILTMLVPKEASNMHSEIVVNNPLSVYFIFGIFFMFFEFLDN